MLKTHTVRPGETLPAIALCYYGTEDAWSYIYQHNRHNIADPNHLYIGQAIVIPHIPGNPFKC